MLTLEYDVIPILYGLKIPLSLVKFQNFSGGLQRQKPQMYVIVEVAKIYPPPKFWQLDLTVAGCKGTPYLLGPQNVCLSLPVSMRKHCSGFSLGIYTNIGRHASIYKVVTLVGLYAPSSSLQEFSQHILVTTRPADRS